MKIINPEERYFTWRDSTERVIHAYIRLRDDIECNLQSDKDLDNFNTLLELLDTACDFANSHSKELKQDYERWLENLNKTRKEVTS